MHQMVVNQSDFGQRRSGVWHRDGDRIIVANAMEWQGERTGGDAEAFEADSSGIAFESSPGGDPCAALAQPEVLSNFGFDRENLTATHLAQIRRIAQCIVASQRAQRRVVSVRLVGHTDPVGADDYNLRLGRRRAASAATALSRELDRLQPGLSGRLATSVETRGEQAPIPGDAAASRRVEVFLAFSRPPVEQPTPGQPTPGQPTPGQPPPRPQCLLRPSVNGFRFTNSFALPAAITNALSRLGIPVGSGRYGLCGGMSFLAADHFAFGMPIPTQNQVPPLGSALYNKLVARQLDSLNLNVSSFGTSFGRPVLRFLEWMARPDRGNQGVAALTAPEFRAAAPNLTVGRRVMLGLVYVSLTTGAITNNHQVLAHCLTQLSPTRFLIHIYDPNFPMNNDVRLDVRVVGGEVLTTQTAPGTRPRNVRGFFVMSYSPVRP